MNLATTIGGHPADAPALFSNGLTITYGELNDRVDRLRSALATRGVEPGDRVVISAANTWNFVVAYYATLGLGAVAVPLNPLSPGPELARELDDVEPSVIIVGPTGMPAYEAAVTGGEMRHKAALVVSVGKAPDEAGPTVLFDDLLASASLRSRVVDREPDDVAVLMFTSGTAGLPKAAMLTHGNLETNQRQTVQHPGAETRADDTVFGVLPLFHIFGLNSALGVSMSVGAAVVLVQRFDPVAAVETIATRQVSVVAGPPTLWTAFATMPSVSASDFSSVRLAISGAAKLSAMVADMAAERLGLRVAEAYGLTETSPAVAIGTDTATPKGSIGRPVPGVEMRLVDQSGEDVLVGDEGEIWVRGPNVFPGYWRDPQTTAKVLDADGWLHTGDVAVVDDDGYVYIVDRAKDLIIVSGFNVYPAEVEAVLLAHPSVADVAVSGAEHPHTGETVRAFVRLVEDRPADEDELIEFCGTRLARYKCPGKVTFVDEIPHGLGGKILRRDLPSEP